MGREGNVQAGYAVIRSITINMMERSRHRLQALRVRMVYVRVGDRGIVCVI